MQKNTPVIVSRQSGVAEVLRNALKVDFWDVRDIASKVLAVLKYRELAEHLTEHGSMEVQQLTWDRYAERLESIYGDLLATNPFTASGNDARNHAGNGRGD